MRKTMVRQFQYESVGVPINLLILHIATELEKALNEVGESPIIRVEFLVANTKKRFTSQDLIKQLSKLTIGQLADRKVWKGGEVKTLGLVMNQNAKDFYQYHFDFDNHSYYCRGIRIHFTPGEALALYRKLVLKQDNLSDRSFFANLRQKHGKDFLKGYL